MVVFKAYDVRALYPEELNDELAYKIGRAFVIHTGASEVMIGQDSRLSSPPLFAAISRGIMDQGANVIDIGLTSTPMTKYLQVRKKCASAIQVTASHNPKEYGGFKFYGEEGKQITGDNGIPIIEQLVEKNDFPEVKEKGRMWKEDISELYVDYLVSLVNEDVTDLFVTFDASNGPAGIVAEEVFDNLNVQFSALNFEPDGEFPGHDPNPLKGNAKKDTIMKIAEMGADLGCIVDADADRAIFVDEEGKPIKSDLIHAAVAVDFIKNNPGTKILVDCFSSHAVKDAIEGAGGVYVIERTGAAFISARMQAEDIMYGGETSGHYFFKDISYADDGLYMMLCVMQLVARSGKHISEIVKEYDVYHDTDQINIPVEDAHKAIELVAKEFSKYEQSRLDGVSIDFKDGKGTWCIARPSNTEPIIRVRVESKDEKIFEELKEKIVSLVSK